MGRMQPIGFGYNTPNILPIGKIKSISGTSPLVLPDALPRKPKNITIYGNTIDGVGVGDYNTAANQYEIPIIISGINLLDTTQERVVLAGSLPEDEYTSGIGTLSFCTNFYITSTNVFGIKAELKPNTKYQLSYTTITGRATIRIYDESCNVIASYNNFGSFRFNLLSATTVYICFQSNSWGMYTELTNILLSEIFDASYEPYITPSKCIIPIERPLYDGEYINTSIVAFSTGTNIISVPTNIPPSLIKCSYYVS